MLYNIIDDIRSTVQSRSFHVQRFCENIQMLRCDSVTSFFCLFIRPLDIYTHLGTRDANVRACVK